MNTEEIAAENSPNVEEIVEDTVEDDGPIEKVAPVPPVHGATGKPTRQP